MDSLTSGGAPMKRFNKDTAHAIKGFGGASFEATFNLKIAKMKKAPGSEADVKPKSPAKPMKAPKRKAAGPPAFSSPAPAPKARRTATPGSGDVKSALAASPATGQAYASRTNAGKVERTLEPILSIPSGPAAASPDSVTVSRVPGSRQADKPYRFMLTRLDQRAAALEERVVAMEELCAKRNWTITPVGVASQRVVVVCGRICPMEDGRLDIRGGVVLEGSRRTSNGARVILDVKGLRTYNLFPGQVVAVEGICTMGTTIVAKRIMEGLPAPMTRGKASELTAARTLRIWAASGPFSLASDLSYTPLRELLAETLEAANPPDLIVLTGPFVDVHHPEIASGRVETKARVPMTFAELFQQKIEEPLRAYLSQAALSTCHVVLLPSLDDAHLVPVFPQPPLPKLFTEVKASASVRARVHCMPNPCTFVVNGVTIGATTADHLRHGLTFAMTRHSGPKAPHMFARITETLVNQRSFYPLYPPPTNVPLETGQQQSLRMQVTPDIMLVPSGVTHFALKLKANKIVAINPGKLVKKNSGGTYARITVYPLPPDRIERLEARATAAATASGSGSGAGAGAGAGSAAGAGTTAAGSTKSTTAAAAPKADIPTEVSQRTKVEIVRI